jgi:hypothetical protein
LPSQRFLVLRPVADQEEQTPRRKRLAKLVQEPLCLRVDPVEILEREEKGLDLALSHEESRERVKYRPAPLDRIQLLPLRVLDRHAQEGEERGE